MSTSWTAFTERHPPSDNEATCGLVALSDQALLLVRGEDAAEFLQGQLTNDVREVSSNHSQLNGHCSPKGRLLASFRLLAHGDGFLLLLPREQREALAKRLRMFVLRAKVTITEPDDLAVMGILGECSEALASLNCPSLPAEANSVVTHEDLSVVRLAGATTRYLVLGQTPRLMTLWQEMTATAGVASDDRWALEDIRAGIPTVYAATRDTFVPQMINLQLIDGVSFNKGCYTGQEIVARMQYLGKLKRRMYLGEVDSAKAPRPGDELHAPSSTSEQASGRVVDARRIEQNRWALLAVAEISAVADGQVHLGENGPPLRLDEPPYGFPSDA